jgi:signal transduction histidine kinase
VINQSKEPSNAADRKASILLVDDEKHILSALKRALQKTPWEIYTARSGEEALEVLEKTSVQVVISDYRMTGMDGVTFLSRVKERWPEVQRVMLTGQAGGDAIEQAVNQSEVFRFLNKPWNDTQLTAMVTESLSRQQLIESNRRYELELAERNQELVEINQDLERKVAERTRALVQIEKMAALGRMAGGVAHEINNPLGGILAFTQLLLRDSPTGDPQVKEALDTIQKCALRCRDIVDNLLSFARKPSEERREISVNQVVVDALVLARLHPLSKSVEVRTELTSDLPPVIGQASLLQQVVVNLLQNAFQASASGQEVVLRTRSDRENVLLEVEDRGMGIPQGIRAQIFEPFFTTKEAGQGTGLGLFICYGIAREHGGDLRVESEEGQGSRFSLELPAVLAISDKEQANGRQVDRE